MTKYRRRVLIEPLNSNMKQHIRDICNDLNIQIIAIESDMDHIHILISYPPKISVSEIVKMIKQKTTSLALEQHARALSKVYWKRRVLWSDGYFVCSVGQASQETIRQYIKNQG